MTQVAKCLANTVIQRELYTVWISCIAQVYNLMAT